MSNQALSVSADVLRMIGLAGIIIAPAAASIAFDVAMILYIRENIENHPFYSGMLFGYLLNRSGPGLFVPHLDKNGEFNSFETGLAITFSAICTASCAIACAFLACPMIAMGIAGTWSICLGLYMLGEGLRGLAQEKQGLAVGQQEPSSPYNPNSVELSNHLPVAYPVYG